MTPSLAPADLSTNYSRLRDTREALDAYLQDEDAKARVMRAASGALRMRRDSLAARELVADVVGDLFSGALAWEPTTPRERWALAMASHVIGELRRRAERSHRATRHLVSLASLVDEDAPPGHEADAEADARADARMGRFERELPVLRARMTGDAQVLKLLGLYESGMGRKSAAVHAGMSPREYHNARRRLVTAARAIDREIRDRDVAGAAVTPIVRGRLGLRRGVLGARVSRVADVAAEPVRVLPRGTIAEHFTGRRRGYRAE